MLITVQSFAAIGRRSSEILRLVKKTSRLKQKAFGTNVPGGLTTNTNLDQAEALHGTHIIYSNNNIIFSDI